MWKLKDLLEHCNTCNTEINGHWVPARPVNYKFRSLRQRLREAYAVFTGQMDAVKWDEQ